MKSMRKSDVIALKWNFLMGGYVKFDREIEVIAQKALGQECML
jgi:hypothetical protein